jgi:tyrosyl-tRNA synthetase
MTETSSIDPVFMEQAAHICRNSEFLPGGVSALAKKLQRAAQENQPLKIKLGLDPTRPDLHLGHTVVLRKLRAFQDLGHEVILLIGDATALIGDPSGRNETRPPLSHQEILTHAQTYLEQAGKVIQTEKAKIVRNSEWLLPLDLQAMLALASKMTVAQMLVRDDFAKRYAGNTPIALHEFLYPLMQAYDSVVIEADIELGGSDQRFNTLLGRDIQQAYGNSNPQSVLLMPIIEGTDGKMKMSKSYPEHCINLTDPPQEMLGKMMSIPDELIVPYMKLLTSCTEEVAASLQEQMKLGQVNPRDIKMELAKWLVTEYHSKAESEHAELGFIQQFKHREIPEEIPEASLEAKHPYDFPSLAVRYQLAASKGEARRLVQGGGVKLDGVKVEDPELLICGDSNQAQVLQVGKRKFLRLVFSL